MLIFDYFKMRMQACMIFLTTIAKKCGVSCLIFIQQSQQSAFSHGLRLTFSCIMLKNGQTDFKILAVFTPQDFKNMFGNFQHYV